MLLEMSICTYENGEFDVMLRDTATGEEIELSGFKRLSPEQFKLIDRIAPACVWTSYRSESC
jgi:hypothetical protein